MGTETMKLTSENVESMVMQCLFNDGEDTTNAIKVEGIMIKIGFDPVKIEAAKDSINSMLDQLPESFYLGMSFLQACEDRNGEQWTGLHKVMDELFCLGMATKKVTLLAPREAWGMLPGGMPYYIVSRPQSK